MRIYQQIKAIAFDVGDTLCYPASGSWVLSPNFFECISRTEWDNIPEKKRQMAQKRASSMLRQIQPIITIGEEYNCFLRYYTMLFYSLPELAVTVNQVKELTDSKIYDNGRAIYYDDVEPCLAILAKTYRIGILSDTWPSLRRMLVNVGIAHYFEIFTLSCDLGTTKPDPRMYHAAIAAFNLKPKEILFVDNLVPNLVGAEKAGIVPIQICRNQQPIDCYPAVDSLNELVTLLKIEGNVPRVV